MKLRKQNINRHEAVPTDRNQLKRYAGLYCNGIEVRIKSLAITKSKTLIGAGIAYVNNKKKTGLTSVIMCPGHLLTTWKKEVEKLIPNGKAYIVKELEELKELDLKIRNKSKKENTYIIISKDIAKSSYLKCPGVNYSISKGAFICPDCGRPLMKSEYVLEEGSRKKVKKYIPLNRLDFLKETSINSVCSYYSEKVVDNKTVKGLESCGSKLWRPLNRYETERKWHKFGDKGWIYKHHAKDLFNEMMRSPELSKPERELLSTMAEHIDKIGTDEEYKGIVAPRKYSLSKYIRNNYKGVIDYFIVDECHLYQTAPQNSLQTQAMVDILLSSNKTVLLTGTLLNGYASGLYYILYNTNSRTMVKDGFDYYDENEFVKRYGVIEQKTKYTRRNSQDTLMTKASKGTQKMKPGVSPLVFTKFLLNNTVFLSLSDMSEGLPNYEEIPIFVEMDEELAEAYSEVQETMKGLIRESDGRLLSSFLQLLSVYPDTPYNQEDIVDPKTGDTVYTPLSIGTGLRNKERETINLIKEKVEQGEKVLLYNEWTKKTDVANKLLKALKDEGIKAKIMSSDGKNKVKVDEREEWIEKELEKGLEVLICNPKLVETGLNLLEFTTIIFYQVGYSIFTLRQASRRSYRLSQTKDVKVYFISYSNTIQATALSLMATKLHAALAIESNFSEEGLRALSDNEDILTKIASSVTNGIEMFEESIRTVKIMASERTDDIDRERIPIEDIVVPTSKVYDFEYTKDKYKTKLNKKDKLIKDILNSILHVGNL